MKYKLLIVLATIIWGLSFVVMKDAVEVCQPAWLLGIRFLSCALLLGIIFWKRVRCAFNREMLVKGAILGVLLFLAYWAQTVGIANTTPGKNAFLTGTYCVMVPFMWWLVDHRKPTVANILAAVICLVGIGLVSLSGDFVIEYGDALTLLSAVFFGVHIVFVAKFSPGADMIVLTIYQFFTQGVCGIIIGVLTEAPPDISAITPAFISNMVYLIVFASCVALLAQNIALAHVSPNQGSLLLSLEAVFGVFFSVVLYGEELTVRLVVGFVLIFVAILLSELGSNSVEGEDTYNESAARE